MMWMKLLIGVLILGFSGLYYRYVKYQEGKGFIIFSGTLLSIYAYMCYIIVSKNTFLFILFLVIFLLLLLKDLLKFSPPKCIKKPKIIGELNNVPIYLCETKSEYSNAWYVREKSGKSAIYVTKRLKEILTEEELSLVLKHEASHHSNSKILRSIAMQAPLLFLTFVILVVLLNWKSLNVGVYIDLISIYFIISLSSSLILRIEEHEADKNAIKSYKDIENFVTALIKIHMDRYRTNFKPFVDVEVKKVKNILSFNLKEEYSFWKFFRDFVSYFIRYLIFSISDIFHKEIFLTHPPIKFRIMYLVNFVKNKKRRR